MFWDWKTKTARPPQPGDLLQADAHGVPAWARTTGEILPFRGAPKTPGFLHHLDGVPMSVVSQLGYVDRGIGKRGIISFVDDFVSGYAGPNGTADAETAAIFPWRARKTASSYHLDAQYESGAVYVSSYGGVHEGHLWMLNHAAFRYDPTRQLWFTARVALVDVAPHMAVVGLVNASLHNAADADVVRLDQWLDVNNAPGEGIFFLKHAGDTDRTFTVVAFGETDVAIATIPNVVGHALGEKEYALLSVRIIAGDVIVYVDGRVVGTIPASDPAVVTLLANQNAGAGVDPKSAKLLPAFGHEEMNTDISGGIVVDHILVAEETQADPD